VPSESTPYWITIAVATVAWLFTSATDQVLRTPYLVYDVNHQLNQQTASLIDTTVTIENITDDKSYSDVELRINADEPDIILDGKVRPDQPAWEGDEAQSFTPHSFVHVFPKIQPAGRFEIYITHKIKDSMHIVLVARKSDILLSRANAATFLVAHHLLITIIMALVLTIISLFGLFVSQKGSSGEETKIA